MEEQILPPIIIYTESTPNPNTLKFVVNRPLLLNDSIELEKDDNTLEAPIAAILFELAYVVRIFVTNNYISVSKDDTVLWAEVMPIVKEKIRLHLTEKRPLFNEAFIKPKKLATNTISDDDSDVNMRIKVALDKYVKPAVEMDGGNISFVRFENGKLVLQLQGSCSGCPSSTVTLKQGIENLMKRFVPEVQEVVAENEESH